MIVAHDFKQAGIAFEDVKAMLFPGGEWDADEWRVLDSSNARVIVHRASGARVQVLSSKPKVAHGIRPLLVLADEPAQWEAARPDTMLGVLETSLGKVPGSRMIALGTRPSDAGVGSNGCWTTRTFRVWPTRPRRTRTWTTGRRGPANPSLSAIPHLQGADRA